VRLLTYNIRYGGRGREKLLASVIIAATPDVVLLQEATDPALVEELARLTGMPWHAARARHSLAALSRVEIAHHSWHRPRRMRRAFLELTLATGVRVYGIHLSAWHTRWAERWRFLQLKSLLRQITSPDAPHVVTGDFNTLAPGEELDIARLPARLRALFWLSGARIRWQTVDAMLAAGYVDAFRSVNSREPGVTFPTWDPHLRLDYAFVTEGMVDKVSACAVITTPPAVDASDHFPLLLELGKR
jgi:exodeoxyribonuclease-3